MKDYLIRWVIRKPQPAPHGPSRDAGCTSGQGACSGAKRDGAAARTQGHFVTAGTGAVPGSTQGAPALSVHNQGKRFGDRIAFQDVSF